MSRRAISAVVLAVALTFAAAPSFAGVKKGDRATELGNVKDRRGKKVKLKQYRGKIVVLTFGASWCKPCRKELPKYNAVAKRYKAQKADVVFVAINIDSERDNANRFLKETGVSKAMRVGFDPNGNAVDKYEPGTMPTTYIIDDKGIVRDVHAGYNKGDEKKIVKKVDALRKKHKLK